MKIRRSALLPFTAEQIFNLVADIASYSEFLAWCKSSTILESSNDEVVAELGVRMAGFNIAFSTRNYLSPNERIDMILANGPFKQLGGFWQFQNLDENATKVSLEIEFEFDNVITQKLMAGKFKSIVSAQLDAFQQRAHFVYGASDA